MPRRSFSKRAPRIAIVVKRTTYRKFVVEEHDPLMAKLIRRRDPTVGRVKQTHDAHVSTQTARVWDATTGVQLACLEPDVPQHLVHVRRSGRSPESDGGPRVSQRQEAAGRRSHEVSVHRRCVDLRCATLREGCNASLRRPASTGVLR